NRGTVGGSIAHADPAAELPAGLLAHGGRGPAPGPHGNRQSGGPHLLLTPLAPALVPEESLTQGPFPPWPPFARRGVVEESRRHGDFAMVGVAVLLTLDATQRCTQVAVALCGVGDRPHKVAAAPALLLGHPLDEARLRDVAQAAAAEIEPDSDLHASAEFRRHLSTVLTQRALRQAAARATP